MNELMIEIVTAGAAWGVFLIALIAAKIAEKKGGAAFYFFSLCRLIFAFIAIAILLFAYSTVLGWSHYGATACRYLFGEKSVLPYRIAFVVVVFLGSVMEAQLAWDISDTFNGLMMIPNLIGVLVLSPLVMKCTKNYVDRKFHGKGIEPMLSMFPDIQAEEAEAIKNAKTAEEAE